MLIITLKIQIIINTNLVINNRYNRKLFKIKAIFQKKRKKTKKKMKKKYK